MNTNQEENVDITEKVGSCLYFMPYHINKQVYKEIFEPSSNKKQIQTTNGFLYR